MRSTLFFVLGAIFSIGTAFAEPALVTGNFTCTAEGRMPIKVAMSELTQSSQYMKLSFGNGDSLEGVPFRKYSAATGETTVTLGIHVVRFSREGVPAMLLGADLARCQ